MIFIKRIAAPAIFTRKNSPALTERKKAEEYYSTEELPAKPFTFKFYSSRKNDYKEYLVKMFNSRCAYCDCNVTAVSRGDIEHFRPKGEFTTLKSETVQPGYYWLASDWENLYLSCISCNQSTTFKILDANNPGVIIERTAGKMNQFALSDEKFRRNSHIKKLQEEEPYRLLIDPCKDDPEELLEFLDNGLLKPRENNDILKEKAQYSIDVYALQREVLVKLRKQKYLDVMEIMQAVDEAYDFVIKNFKEGNEIQYGRLQLEKNFIKLMGFLDVETISNNFIGLARQYIHPFLEVYSQKLAELLDPSNKNEAWYGNIASYLEPQILELKKYFTK